MSTLKQIGWGLSRAAPFLAVACAVWAVVWYVTQSYPGHLAVWLTMVGAAAIVWDVGRSKS